MAPKLVVGGGSLTAAIFSTEAVLAGFEVQLVLDEGSDLVNSWRSVEIGGFGFDNGYHGIDVARAQRLAHRLLLDFQLQVEVDNRESGIVFGGELSGEQNFIGSERLGAQANAGTTHHFKVLDLEGLQEAVSSHHLERLRKSSSRYSDTWNSVRHLYLPWFVDRPAVIASNDEGDLFRNLVRVGALSPTKLRARDTTLEVVGRQWQKSLSKFGNLSIKYKPREAAPGNPASKPQTPGVPFYLSVFSCDPGRLHDFSEVLVVDEVAPEISRVSVHRRGDQSLLLAESFHAENPSVPDVSTWESMLSEFNQAPVRHLESKQTRELVFGSAEAAFGFAVDKQDRELRVDFYSRGPINMAKAEANALAALSEVRKINGPG